jgi:uncharacterized protein (TIGR02594 family)
MPAAARLTDPDNAGGKIASAVSGDIIVNNKPLALKDSVESPHAPWGPPHPPHEAPKIVVASSAVIGNNRGVAYVGSQLSCGHVIVSGSPDVIVGLSASGSCVPGEFTLSQPGGSSAASAAPEKSQRPATAEDRRNVANSEQAAKSDPASVKTGTAKGEPISPGELGDQTENVDSNKIWQTLQNNLQVCLGEASCGGWKETFVKTGTSNQNIMDSYRAVGCPQPNDKVAWCAGFAGAMLKKAGAKYLKTLWSTNYTQYGQAVPLGDPNQWRMNDIVVFVRPGGGHIGFVKAVDPVRQRLLVVGGNQGDNLTQTVFRFASGDGLKVVAIRRAWPLPPAADVSIVTSNIAAAPPNIKVT